MTETQAIARDLARSIATCEGLEREKLCAAFTDIVAQEFDEARFARAFATVHKVFHDWMG